MLKCILKKKKFWNIINFKRNKFISELETLYNISENYNLLEIPIDILEYFIYLFFFKTN